MATIDPVLFQHLDNCIATDCPVCAEIEDMLANLPDGEPANGLGEG